MHSYHYPDYYYSDPGFSDLVPFSNNFSSGIAGLLIGLVLLILIAFFAYAVISYVFTSLSFYTMAKNRSLRFAFLAFIPVARNYLFGTLIGDTVQIASLSIPYASVMLAPASVLTSFFIYILTQGVSVSVFLYPLIILIMLALIVYQCAAFYRLFKLYHPKNAVLYLILNIVFLGLLLPFFLFSIRKKKPVSHDFDIRHSYAVSPCSVLSTVLGVLSVILCLSHYVSLFWCPLSAFILGITDLTSHTEGKKIFSVLGIVLSVICCCLFGYIVISDLLTATQYLTNPLSLAGSHYL